MFNFLKRSGKIIIGAALLMFGILGLLTPIIPGFLLIGIGAAMISPRFREKMKKVFHILKEKWKRYKEDRSI